VKRKLYYLFSPKLRLLLRRVYYLPIDIIDTFIGKRDQLTPPRGLIYVGQSDYKKTGESLILQLQKANVLMPHFRVLDIGCGIGRVAGQLTKILNEKGSYEGFDVVKSGIDWCNKHINKQFPKFKFQYVELKNDLYNLSTESKAENYAFPYKDEEFDLIVLTSVFTHMMPEDVDNYLKNISRVLKKDGKCFATFIILNPEIRNRIEGNPNCFSLPFNFGNYSLLDKNVKEALIAFEEDYLINELITKNNLTIENTYYGSWSGLPKEESLGFQDTIILTKR